MSRTAIEWAKRPSLPASHFVDNAIFTSEEIFREEKEKIFDRVWKFVCHEQELPEPFDYRTTTLAGTPLIISRDGDGRVRGFVNACSHRGSLVLRRPRGNARRWVCPFHQWVYDSDGNCVAIPRNEAYDHCDVATGTMGLREVRTEMRLGLVFVNLDDDCEPLEDFLSGCLASLEECMGTRALEPFHFHRIVLNTNWKLWQLTNLEPYHEGMHVYNVKTNMSQPNYMERRIRPRPRGHSFLESFAPDYKLSRAGKAGESRTRRPFPGLAGDEWRLVNVFPDVMINVRTTVARVDCVIPLGPTRTVVEYRALGIKGESEDDREMRMRHHNEIWGPFGRNLPEDNVASEIQMATMRDGSSVFSIHAREEGERGQDDIPLRNYFREWGRRMGRDPADPFAVGPAAAH